MNRFFMLAVAAAVLLVFAPSSYAICQTCQGMGTPIARCITLSPCSQGANMSACVVGERTLPDNTYYQYCDPMGTTQGSECNGADSSCHTGGGNGGGNTGGGSTGGGCSVAGGEVCPAQCPSCGTRNNDCFCE